MLYCSGDIVVADNGVADMEHTPYLRHSAGFYLFGLIWFAGFMNAMGYMIVAGVVYLCTFADPKNMLYPDGHKNCVKDVPPQIMTISALLMTRYHMGTAAKGSLMLSVTWIFREIFGLFFRLAKLAQESGSFVKSLCCCTNQCVHAFGCL